MIAEAVSFFFLVVSLCVCDCSRSVVEPRAPKVPLSHAGPILAPRARSGEKAPHRQGLLTTAKACLHFFRCVFLVFFRDAVSTNRDSRFGDATIAAPTGSGFFSRRDMRRLWGHDHLFFPPNRLWAGPTRANHKKGIGVPQSTASIAVGPPRRRGSAFERKKGTRAK
ncbi:hypothetical protein [Pandoravirus japonicus]|uniref:Uncharacterized protein n=1 Tax=Pandoravirus japonicus TaxID=2823154 RepID=A0A811BNP8_9VIRU|nr:hypothetical protein [Pandoravirus japonicus]